MKDDFAARCHRQAQLAIAILDAYHVIGDSRDLPAVERLAAGKGLGRHEAVRQAAEKCRAILQERAAQEHGSQTYLRASSAPNAAPETLLRAAQGVSQTEPQELLRASDKSD